LDKQLSSNGFRFVAIATPVSRVDAALVAVQYGMINEIFLIRLVYSLANDTIRLACSERAD